MIVAISGASGFIGQALTGKMRDLAWTLKVIPREAFKLTDAEFLVTYIEGCDAVINLAGAPVAKKWTAAWKQEILDSRVLTTRKISTAISLARQKPAVFLSASAIGIYDSANTHTEASTAFSDSFLAKVCMAWEEEALNAQPFCRVIVFRNGLVLGSDGGALKKMHLPFSIGLGAKLGGGRQSVSFIHITDLVDAMLFATGNREISGVVNAVSPYPTNNAEFSDCLAKVLYQSCRLTIPAFALKMLYGEGASILLEGQKVLPEKLEQAGFRFKYPTIQNSLVKIYG
ncbi:MAG: TIGR01777 family oxidoreductase [Bacteroidota bacterium]